MKKYIVWDPNNNCPYLGFSEAGYTLSLAESICNIINNSDIHLRYAIVKEIIIKPEKIIQGTPLDPTLPILMAGHLQDRQRKRYRA